MTKLKPKGRNDGHIVDYSLIIDKIYIGSNLCKGSVCPIHGNEFRELGVCVEINLDNERKEIPPDDMESYNWIPVVDGHPPNEIQLDLGTEAINTAVVHGRTVYVHCKNGHGRSPTLVAAYLIRYKDMTPHEANEFIKLKRPEIHIESSQMKALEDYYNKYK